MNARGALLALLMLVAGPAVAEPEDKHVTLPDGRILNLWCDGKSGPVVLLDSGWAADSRAWRRVMALLSPDFRVCAQDRAGSGFSDAGPLPRDGEAIARDLHAAVQGMPGPYIVVGHSIGALNMRAFARLFPSETQGLVLVDPSTPQPGVPYAPGLVERSRNCLAAAKQTGREMPVSPGCRASPPEKAEIRWQARLSELESLDATAQMLSVEGAGSLSIPTLVLSAGQLSGNREDAPRFAEHRKLAAISANGRAILVNDSGHMMIFDRPDAIADAVRSLRREEGLSAER